jgi:hypothetical protein
MNSVEVSRSVPIVPIRLFVEPALSRGLQRGREPARTPIRKLSLTVVIKRGFLGN